ncbi:hypothetical protein MmiAt1_06210 [Methanimicrococcus sp. At1]|uniref:DUF3784 domain-containing protein n=1 Tax=Methanimicrococcus hacksteinii TaxID=3028293 RepID=A0ABU3VNT5_9EURY|nr:DUF3784 domain-containing protein [Methanimicrococcus sp. At1]MDV0445066.1 hypothetical protein [Methanimicrococcus sp. At1]
MVFDISYLAFLVPVLLLALAVYFFSGRGAFLISGYNTLPKEEKEKYNLKELTRLMGIFALVIAVLIAVTLYFGIIAGNMMWALVGLISVVIFTLLWMFYLNTNKKIKDKPY